MGNANQFGGRVDEIVSSVAALLWPVLFLIALLMFRGPVGRVIRSAERREFTLNVGGQEISVKQLSEQQDDMIADLQAQLSRVTKELEVLRAGPSAPASFPWSPPAGSFIPYSGPHSYAVPGGSPGGQFDIAPNPYGYEQPADTVPWLSEQSSSGEVVGGQFPEPDQSGTPPPEPDTVPERDAASERDPMSATDSVSERNPVAERNSASEPDPVSERNAVPDRDVDAPADTDGDTGFGWPESPSLAYPPSWQPADPPSGTAGWWQAPGRPTERVTAALLWVDDNPQNNALIVDRLKRNGIRVDLARTTDEALTLLDKRRAYGAIVSDWGRTERDTRVSDAGRWLTETARERGIDTPIIIYTNMFGPADTRRKEALQAGANFVTGSTTQLLAELTALGLLPS